MLRKPMGKLKLAEQVLLLTCENKGRVIFSDYETETILSHSFTFECLAVSDTFWIM